MEENNNNTETQEKKEIQAVDDAVAVAVAVEKGQEGEEKGQEVEKELTPEEINWRKFREERARERDEKESAIKSSKEKDSQIEALTNAMDRMLDAKGSPSLTQKEQEEIISDLSDEDLTTGGEVKGFLKKFVPEIISEILDKKESERAQKKAQRAQKEMPVMLRQKHKDFDDFVTQENLDYLDYHYPEVANALGAVSEGVEKWSSIYKTVKKLVPNSGVGDLRRIEKNSQKPQSVTTATAQQSKETGYGKRLTDLQKQENYKKLQELARGA